MRNLTIDLDPAQRERAATILANSFQKDPMYQYVLPNDHERARKLHWLMGKVVYYSLLYGQVYATSTIEGVVCWLPPGQTELTIVRVIKTGLFAIIPRFGLEAYRRFNDNMAYTEKVHKCCAIAPHWYLWAIGVDPSCQGQGIGGKLMQPILESASSTGTHCYLETHNQKNIRFYEKYGFKVINEGKVPKHGLHVWAMLREP